MGGRNETHRDDCVSSNTHMSTQCGQRKICVSGRGYWPTSNELAVPATIESAGAMSERSIDHNLGCTIAAGRCVCEVSDVFEDPPVRGSIVARLLARWRKEGTPFAVVPSWHDIAAAQTNLPSGDEVIDLRDDDISDITSDDYRSQAVRAATDEH